MFPTSALLVEKNRQARRHKLKGTWKGDRGNSAQTLNRGLHFQESELPRVNMLTTGYRDLSWVKPVALVGAGTDKPLR